MNPVSWRYYCTKCRFHAHINCATQQTSRDEETQLDEANLLHFPLTTPLDFLKVQATNEERSILSLPWPCNYHKSLGISTCLKPQQANLINEDVDDDDQLQICDACVTPIIPHTTFYRCNPIHPSCDFFLHEVCSRLPLTLPQHPSHPQHPLLRLVKLDNFYDLVQCKGCGYLTNGLVYRCESCNFYLDAKCALLPTIILHKAHKDPLLLLNSNLGYNCNACREFHDSGFRYGCTSCDYRICSKSVLWSQSIRHSWDEHPLSLIFRAEVELPEEGIPCFCEKCELKMYFPDWFYHCCDNFFHPECMPQHDKYSNIKFGGILRHEKHPHPLEYLRRSKIHTTKCKRCSWEIEEDEPLFECTESCGFESCDFAICHRCIKNKRWNRQQNDDEDEDDDDDDDDDESN